MTNQTLENKNSNAVSHIRKIIIILFCAVFLLPKLSFAITQTCTAPCTIDISDAVTVSAIVGGVTTPPGNPGNTGGGGGGGSGYSVLTGITFSGFAYPSAQIFILNNGIAQSNTTADANAHFSITLSPVSAGLHLFSIVAEDTDGVRSILITIPITLGMSTTTSINNIFVPPTLSVSAPQYRRTDNVRFFGQSVPSSLVALNLDGLTSQSISTDGQGIYSGTIDTTPLTLDGHTIQSKTTLVPGMGGQTSGYSKLISFLVKSSIGNLFTDQSGTTHNADLNGDGVVNIVDFSILAYWYKKDSPPSYVDLSSDGEITIVDFSILAYQWNG